MKTSMRNFFTAGMIGLMTGLFCMTGVSASEAETETEIAREADGVMEEKLEELVEKHIASREEEGEVWAVKVIDLSTGEAVSKDERTQLLSASVIKVFILGAVYDAVDQGKLAEEEIAELAKQMITVSDNDASNTLVEMLGKGNFGRGAREVNRFCIKHRYGDTLLQRRFLGSNENGDNMTSARDCARILQDIYEGTCVSEEASEKMLNLLKGQQCTEKIPQGLPAGTVCANKTGEMPLGYGLGCIENDIAIIYAPETDYVLVVLSNELDGRNDEAREVIREISGDVWNWFA